MSEKVKALSAWVDALYNLYLDGEVTLEERYTLFESIGQRMDEVADSYPRNHPIQDQLRRLTVEVTSLHNTYPLTQLNFEQIKHILSYIKLLSISRVNFRDGGSTIRQVE